MRCGRAAAHLRTRRGTGAGWTSSRSMIGALAQVLERGNRRSWSGGEIRTGTEHTKRLRRLGQVGTLRWRLRGAVRSRLPRRERSASPRTTAVAQRQVQLRRGFIEQLKSECVCVRIVQRASGAPLASRTTCTW
ncbi:uncharacterized protein CC84DRAFT_516399 [Paraphaeosphaeria sporulosa]|uniref:Uncharacterized protein n=1 Tax=Paraphaeosphaeria sporulosa TaxID=1460663 RepID=A0A177CVX7_9PLEO|nr:uncharacterized protein CC84DRAFT_516399 [Paraphaeosphaeria sporulosa]OAG11020.1 hypothetical protein CC84DRAFT_516399 [Paraphaeosphaeria sporulosa]